MNYQEFYKLTNAGNRIVDKFGIVLQYPSYEELQRIISEITAVPAEQRTTNTWRDTIKQYVRYQEEKEVADTDIAEVHSSLDEIMSILNR